MFIIIVLFLKFSDFSACLVNLNAGTLSYKLGMKILMWGYILLETLLCSENLIIT